MNPDATTTSSPLDFAAAGETPAVSVVIIFYNPGVAFLAEAVQSVFDQTCGDWELLLCDDGSTDDSSNFARACAARFPGRVRYLEHPGHENRGMSAARNLGLRHARGTYVAWLDADDIWVPHKLRDQLDLIAAHPEVAMVYGPARYWYSWTGRPEDVGRDYDQPNPDAVDRVLSGDEVIARFLVDDHSIPTGVLVRRSAVEEAGGYDESFREEFEDMIVHFKVCQRHPAYLARRSWYLYRQHEKSCCAVGRRAGREAERRMTYLRRLEEYLRTAGRASGTVWDAVQDQIAVVDRSLRTQVHGGNGNGDSVNGNGDANSLRKFSRRVAKKLVKVGARVLPRSADAALRRLWFARAESPPHDLVHFGGLRRVTPVSRNFGCERGQPTDRYYVEQFLAAHRDDIRGRVMEIGDASYTRKFGDDRVTTSDVLHARHGNPIATLVGDLESGAGVPRDAFDCIILTQVLLCVYDVRAALRHTVAALKPGGVLLATLPCIAQISRYDQDRWGDFWRFTSRSAQRLFAEVLPPESFTIDVYGNVLSAAAMLYGVAANELTSAELDFRDRDYEVIIAVRAVKPTEDQASGRPT